MAKTLLAEVLVTVETNLDGASGALVAEARRVQRLKNDLQGIRKTTDEGVGSTRETTITGLFFGGFLSKSFQAITESSGAVAAIISVVGGLTGTVIDTVVLALLDLVGGVDGVFRRLKESIDVDEGDIVVTPFGPLPDVTANVPPSQILTIAPLTGVSGALAEIPDSDPGDLPDMLGAAIARISGISTFFNKDDTVAKAEKQVAEYRKTEDVLTSDPTKTMANFWVNAITKTNGWKALVSGASGNG